MGFFKSTSKLINAIENGDKKTVGNYFSSAQEIQNWTAKLLKDKYVTPLAAAAKIGDLELIETLLDAGVDINQQCKSRATALYLACTYGNDDAALLLLDRGADPFASDTYDHDYVDSYNYRYEYEDSDYDNWEIMITSNDIRVFEKALEQGRIPQDNDVLKLICRETDRYPFYELLKKHGYDIKNEKNLDQRITSAITNDNKGMVEELAKAGAPVKPDIFQRLAAEPKLFEMFKLLDKLSLVPANNVLNVSELLSVAIDNRNIPFAKAMIEKGADVNKHNSKGDTALHRAIERKSVSAVELLLKSDANIHATDVAGYSARYMALMLSEDMDYKSSEAAILRMIDEIEKEQKSQDVKNAGNVGNGWEMTDDVTVAHISFVAASQKRITDIFNFEKKERLIIVDDLQTKVQSIAPEDFDKVSETTLARAFNAYKDAGGTMTEDQALSIFTHKSAFSFNSKQDHHP